jgi:antitoxin MazE
METQVRKWGNSLGVRLPLAIATQANILDGTKVDIVFKKNRIEIIPLKLPEYSLEELLSNISTENTYKEISTGESLGNEIW